MDINKNVAWTQGGFSIDDNCVWFVPYMLNVLCKYNFSSNRMEKVIYIPEISVLSAGYYNVIKIQSFVVMIPGFENNVCVFDTTKNIMKIITIPAEKCVRQKFQYASIWEGQLFLFPVSYSSILRVSLNDFKVERIAVTNGTCNGFVSATIANKKVYLVNETNKLYVFDMEEECISEQVTFNNHVNLKTVSVMDEQLLILTDTQGNVYTYNLLTNLLNTIWEESGMLYDSCVCYGEKILLIPLLEKDYFEVGSVTTKKKTKIELSNVSYFENWPHAVFSKPLKKGSKVYFFSTQYKTLLQYDFETSELIEMVPEYGEMDFEDVSKLIHHSSHIGGVKEGIGLHATLDTFLKVILSDKSNK